MFLNQILRIFETKPNNNCFFIKGRAHTYSELEKAVKSICTQLDSFHLDTNENVAINCADDFYTYASLLAVWFSGKAYVPLGVDNPLERNLRILHEANCKVIIAITELDSSAYGLFSIISPKVQEVNEGDVQELHVPLLADTDTAYILFTSGSTGLPKGVPISFANLESFVVSFSRSPFSVLESDRCLQMFELTFDVSISSFLSALLVGACVYTVPNEGLKYINVLKLLQEHKLTAIQIVPSIIRLAKPFLARMYFPDLRICILTGEATSYDLLSEFKRVSPGANFYNYYGPTEATIYCSYYDATQTDLKTYNGMLAIGAPLYNVKMMIVDAENNEVLNNEKGELLIGGSQLTGGYLNNETKNEHAFLVKRVNDIDYIFYKSGDLCYRDQSGTIFYCGRLDNQVKVQGFRVELNEIEMVIMIEMKINNVVIPIENKFGAIELFIALESTAKEVKMLAAEILVKKLPTYMVPRDIFVFDNFPLGSSGKIDRPKIKETILNELRAR